MKILVLTPWFPSHQNDQCGNFILDSVKSLNQLGHEVIVVNTRTWRPRIRKKHPIDKELLSPLSSKYNLHVCEYLSIPRGYLNFITHFFFRKKINPLLRQLAREFQCQIIHAHTELAGISAVDVGRSLGLPTLITLHGISTDKNLYKGRARKLLFEYTLSKASRIILVGKSLKHFAQQFIPCSDHFRVVPNGFRLTDKNPKDLKKSWLENFFRFISVSNLVEGKGIEINIRAFAKLKNEGITQWSYKIIGGGVERKKLQNLVEQLDLGNHITFLGQCNHDVVYQHLLEADIFTLPSYREAFGVAYVEAMSFGLLTIGVFGEGPQDFITHKKTGLLVKPNNVDSLFACFQEIFKSASDVKEMANAGKKYVFENITWENHAKNLTSIYDEVIK